MGAPRRSAANTARLDRLSGWYLPGRFGLFFHYGPFTGGGSAADDSREPIAFPTPEAFEAAAPEPRLVARNMAAAAADAGARYAILTVCHTCAGHTVLYPTERPEFLHRTRQDWVGAFLSECRAAGVKPMLYLPGDANNWNNPQTGPNVAPDVARDPARFAAATAALLDEMRARYGDAPAGFWLDGGLPPTFRTVPARIRALWPRAVVVANGASELDCDDVDMGTTEILGNPRTFLPPYDRPGAYRFFANGSRDGRDAVASGASGGGAPGVNRWNGRATPQTDFNEDIPSPHHWWFHGEDEEIMPECAADRFFLLRTMLCSLGRRGRWNFAPGIGPRLDGTMPPRLKPQLDAIRDFLAWAGEAVYGTRGPAGTFLRAGWTELRGGRAFYAATVRLDDPSVCYALFTETPSGRVLVDTSGFEPRRATDLRTGRELPFRMGAGPIFESGPWDDVAARGAAVVKLEF